MMDISHLYHDATFGDPTLELDVKEQLKTREVNAREERNLQRMHKSYDREMDICEKNTAWERWKVGQSLQGIWERSPRLEKRLAMEKARIEALERSILYRNFFRMNSHVSDYSMASRSVTKVSLKPLQDHKMTQLNKSNPKKKEKFNKDNDENNKNNNNNDANERGFVRQADFVRRSEHSIKALAKLNWKQQNRRRDHEKFKEDLYFHSKPVFEKAKVVLKGRPDIDVENLHTGLENMLLPPVKKPPNFDLKPQFKNSNSNLYEKNVLRLGDSLERKHPPYLTPLAPVSENLESSECDTNLTKSHQDIENDSKHNCISGNDNNAPVVENNNKPSSDGNTVTSVTNDTPGTDGDSDISKLPILVKTTTSNINSEQSVEKTITSENHPSRISSTSLNNKGVNTSDFIDSNSKRASNSNHIEQQENEYQHEQQQTTLPTHPFSPSTSISQVIIEENEEDLEKVNSGSGDEVQPDINNNSITLHAQREMFSAKSATSGADPGVGSSYTMVCTTGLPQIWKQAKKPKEKAPPEVSASAIARKHKRKRRDRW